MVEAETEPPHPPRFNRCECVLRLDILQNVERGMVDLSKAPPVPKSPLLGFEEKNVWVTAGDEFLAHLRHVGVRKPITWAMRVFSDAELTTAWLASVALQGKDILDADAYKVSTRFITLVDLAMPPDLLVIRLGVKAARNQAAPEVLQEALQTRLHEGKPTWIWDEPHHPLNAGHLFWSDSVGRTLRKFERFSSLDAPPTPGGKPGTKTKKPRTGKSQRMGRKSLRNGGDS